MLCWLLLAAARAHLGEITVTELRIDGAGAEWVELRNNAATDFDLRAIELGDSAGTLVGFTAAVTIPAGGYVVVGSAAEADVDAVWSGLELAVAAGSVRVYEHGAPTDYVTWTAAWGLSAGVPHAVGPQAWDLEWANDLASSWCPAAGTPGADNGWCGDPDRDDDADGWTVREGDCDDAHAGRHPEALDGDEGDGAYVDDDCDGTRDEDGADDDRDGYTEAGGDCGEGDPLVYPGALEVPCDGVDQDCDGADTCGGSDTDDPDTDGILDSDPPDPGADTGADEPDPGCGCGGLGNSAWAWGVVALLTRRRSR